MRTVYLHIGTFKTGTTRLQNHLWNHRHDLADNGILYPSEHCRKDHGHVMLPASLIKRTGRCVPLWLEHDRITEKAWDNVLTEMAASPCDRVILSSEHFCNLAEYDPEAELIPAVKRYLAGYDVRIVCYLRRPDSYLLSWYNQVVKMLQTTLPFESFYSRQRNLNSIHLYLGRILDAWANSFGQENIQVHSFESMRASHGDIASHFMHEVCNIETPPCPAPPKVNASLGGNGIESAIFCKLINNATSADGRLDLKALQSGYEEYLGQQDPETLLSMDIVHDIKDHVRHISRHYLPEYSRVCTSFRNAKRVKGKLVDIARGRKMGPILFANFLRQLDAAVHPPDDEDSAA